MEGKIFLELARIFLIYKYKNIEIPHALISYHSIAHL